MITLGIPQIIYIVINIIGLFYLFYKSPSEAIFSLVTWIIVTLPLLYWGGFF